MIALARGDAPTRERDLERVLVHPSTPDRYRHLAALLLGHVNSRLASKILVDALDTADPRLRGTIARGLGRLGDERAFSALADVSRVMNGVPLAQVRFAQRLIAHRVGLEFSTDDPDPEFIPFAPDEAEGVPFVPATRTEANECLRSLALDPFGIELSERGYEMRCGRARLMLLLDRALGEIPDAQLLFRRRWLAGVVACKSDAGAYSVMLLLLTTPAGNDRGCTIAAWQPTGARSLVGDGWSDDAGLRFELRGIARCAGFAAHFSGRLDGRGIDMHRALSGVLLHQVRQLGRDGSRPAPRANDP
ncbi:MAG: hypothetical protein MNPFHGCM_02611 [Gemmatimonadaceae bacterium]|nr:hypothetical protein [Gemmatimonadaceae bacterium]